MPIMLPLAPARTKYRSPNFSCTMSRMMPSQNCGKYRRWQLTMIFIAEPRQRSSSATTSDGIVAMGFSTMQAFTPALAAHSISQMRLPGSVTT